MQQIDDFSVRTPCFIPGQIPQQKLEKHVCRQQQQQVFGVRPFWGPPAALSPMAPFAAKGWGVLVAQSTAAQTGRDPGWTHHKPWHSPWTHHRTAADDSTERHPVALNG